MPETTPDPSARPAAPLIELDGASQVFHVKGKDLPAVSDVSLSVGAGEVLCLVGESGSGKTTTARLAAGLASPTSGAVRYEGRDLTEMTRAERREYRRAVQYIHQDPYASLNPIRSVRSTLSIPLRKHGLAKTTAEVDRRVDELLTTVDLTPPESYSGKFPHQMSGGQRQRVSVARGLTLSPRLLIADESTSMLDVSIRVSLLNMLTKLRKEEGVGFIYITHDLALAKYFAWEGRTAVMYLGKIVEVGPTQQVINNPQHPYTRALLDAVPEPDPELAAQKKAGGGLLSADIPSLSDLPTGCTFHPRCPLAQDRCREVVPTLQPVPGDVVQDVACMVVTDPGADGRPTAAAAGTTGGGGGGGGVP
ncbi:peptide ABC transporter ATP-binding protein [Brachybacterium ginsengisoli]|uniref:Peptide ABC transporter ATP-binding protein n=1 Tax=Brachybacterium ginsengisoli TaxID=1331682 RepID=A0A291GTU3_9MICO|nr:ABC transporter ATP-binding protein [Brachybacterium ginsengisoli]ATG53572.1 peptide ABC transporter ATP-binding protein [Brachybacterium ginsengisoli]